MPKEDVYLERLNRLPKMTKPLLSGKRRNKLDDLQARLATGEGTREIVSGTEFIFGLTGLSDQKDL